MIYYNEIVKTNTLDEAFEHWYGMLSNNPTRDVTNCWRIIVKHIAINN